MAKNMKKKRTAKSLSRAGGSFAVAVAVTMALSTQAYAEEVNETVVPGADIAPAEPVVESVAGENSDLIVTPEINESIEEENFEVLAENEDIGEHNDQVEQENAAAAESNEALSGGELTDPGLELPEAPAEPATEGLNEEGYNQAVDQYNETVEGYNEAVDSYNEAVDSYNAEAEAYDQAAQEQYQQDKTAYEDAYSQHQEDLVDYHETDLVQYQNDLDAYNKYLEAVQKYEADKVYYETVTVPGYEAATEAYNQFVDSQAAYDAAIKAYQDARAAAEAQYHADKAAAQQQHDADKAEAEQQYIADKEEAYQKFLQAQAAYEEAKKSYEDACVAEDQIYEEVTDYNAVIQEENQQIADRNEALAEALDSAAVASLDAVDDMNANVTVEEGVLETLDTYDALVAGRQDLLDRGAALDADERRDDALDSETYAAYLAEVQQYNADVEAYNSMISAYNEAVGKYNDAVASYNETNTGSSDTSTGTGTTESTSSVDWGNINVSNHTVDHVDVKYKAAASKDVTVDPDGNKTYTDTVTQYEVTGVYTDKEAAERDSKSYGLTYDNDGSGPQGSDTQALYPNGTYSEFGVDHNKPLDPKVRIDPAKGSVSFYVTLKDNENNSHGITVNLNANSVYAEGSYYKAQPNDYLSMFVDSEGKGLPTVTIGRDEYYDISGRSVFLISALTCDGMQENGTWWWGSSGDGTLNPNGLDLVLNLQTMIELHKADNANKIRYLTYELGKTAQAEKRDHEAFPEDDSSFSYPDFQYEDFQYGEFSYPDYEGPTDPEDVPNPGEKPEPPAPPAEVERPDEPIEPSFDQTEPEAPKPTDRLDHAEKLNTLEEKVIAEIVPAEEDTPSEPGIPELPAEEPVPASDAEPVPQSRATPPKTGDISSIWAAVSAFSLGGIALLNKKRKK